MKIMKKSLVVNKELVSAAPDADAVASGNT